LQKLAMRHEAKELQLDGIIIETTGMADPAPIAQTFFMDPAVEAFARLDGLVTLVDAKHIEQHLDEEKPEGVENEAIEQIAFADRVLLNKTDLVSEADLDRVECRLRAVNAFAPIQRCCQSKVSVDYVLDVGGFDLKRALDNEPDFLKTDGEHQHDASVSSLSIKQEGEVYRDDLENWLGELLKTKASDIYRMKGVVAIAHADKRFVYQAVHMIYQGDFDEPWGVDEPRQSKLVFIGKNLDKAAITEGFRACCVSPERHAKKVKMLRFGVGDAVECLTGPRQWSRGKVVATLYRDDSMDPGFVAPYQVKLDSGEEALASEDAFIRPAQA